MTLEQGYFLSVSIWIFSFLLLLAAFWAGLYFLPWLIESIVSLKVAKLKFLFSGLMENEFF